MYLVPTCWVHQILCLLDDGLANPILLTCVCPGIQYIHPHAKFLPNPSKISTWSLNSRFFDNDYVNSTSPLSSLNKYGRRRQDKGIPSFTLQTWPSSESGWLMAFRECFPCWWCLIGLYWSVILASVPEPTYLTRLKVCQDLRVSISCPVCFLSCYLLLYGHVNSDLYMNVLVGRMWVPSWSFHLWWYSFPMLILLS